MKKFSITEVLLATQSALLNVIKPALRAVVVNLDTENDIFFIRFYHHGEISEETLDLWQCACTEASCHLIISQIDEEIIRLDYPSEIPLDGHLAYLRKEPNISQEILKLKNSFVLPYKEEKCFLGNVNRAMQNALLGQANPNIREIAINNDENCIYVHFYYEGEIIEADIKNMHEIMDLFCKSFRSFIIRLRYFRIDKSEILPFHPVICYSRFEERYNNAPYYVPKDKIRNC